MLLNYFPKPKPKKRLKWLIVILVLMLLLPIVVNAAFDFDEWLYYRNLMPARINGGINKVCRYIYPVKKQK